MVDKYCIVRMFREEGKRKKIIARGLTLEDAKAHCSDQRTKNLEAGWMDGFTKEGA